MLTKRNSVMLLHLSIHHFSISERNSRTFVLFMWFIVCLVDYLFKCKSVNELRIDNLNALHGDINIS